jgi:hypothetical protein
VTFPIGRTPPQTITVTQAGYLGTFRATVSNARVVSVSPASAQGPVAKFMIAAISFGTASVAVSTSNSATVNVPVNVPACLPPVPDLFETYPANGSVQVPSNAPRAIFAISSSDVLYSQMNFFAFYARLISPDGVAHNGSPLAPAATPLPSPMATPPFSNPTYFASSLPPLKAGTQYQVLLVSATLGCLPLNPTGLFTTR